LKNIYAVMPVDNVGTNFKSSNECAIAVIIPLVKT